MCQGESGAYSAAETIISALQFNIESDLIVCSTAFGSILIFDLYSELIKDTNDPNSAENSRILTDSIYSY